MTKPNFLGIGGMRCGSTWLHNLLATHPSIYVPQRRKELKFFDLNYNRGPDWYESFFPNDREREGFAAIGEVSPTYLTDRQSAPRIAEMRSVERFIVILRNPVDRAYSHYSQRLVVDGYRKSFKEYLGDHPHILRYGYYGYYMRHFFRYCERSSVLPLIFEEAVQDVEATKRRIGHFLDIPPEGFPTDAGRTPANGSYVPHRPRLNKFAYRLSACLRRLDLDRVIEFAKAAGASRVLQGRRAHAIGLMPEETRDELARLYQDDIDELEELLGVNLDCWRRQSAVESPLMAPPLPAHSELAGPPSLDRKYREETRLH